MNFKKQVAAASAATAVLMALTGCGSSVDAAATETGGDVEQVEAGARNPGQFATTPREKFGDPGVDGALSGGAIEAQRMVEFVIIPTELDPALTEGGESAASNTMVPSPDKLTMELSSAAPIAVENGGLLAFESARGEPQDAEKWKVNRNIEHMVVRFRDAAGAARAAQELHQYQITEEKYPTRWAEFDIAALPNSFASEGFSGDDVYMARAFTAHDQYVFVTDVAGSPQDKAWADEMLTKAVELQGPLIDKFPATAPDEFDNLPVDIDNVLRLAVTTTAERPESLKAVYGPRGAAHFSRNPTVWVDLLAKTKTYRMARDVTDVYMSKTETGAKELMAGIAKDAVADGMIKIDSPPGLSDATCWERPEFGATGTNYLCQVQRGKYVGESLWAEKDIAYQMITAQAMILEGEK